MSLVRVRVQGLDALLRNLKATPEEIDRGNQQAMMRAALLVEAAAKELEQPYHRTGRLYTSIHGSVEGSGSLLKGIIGTNVVYGPMIEYGAPAGFPINYAKGRRTKYGRTRAYVAHLRKPRRGRHYLETGLRSSVAQIAEQFRLAAQEVARRIANG